MTFFPPAGFSWSLRLLVYNTRMVNSMPYAACADSGADVITESVRNTPNADLHPPSGQPSCSTDLSETDISFHSSAAEEEPAFSTPTAHVRPSHPLKSFAVPAIPAHPMYDSAALPSTPLLSQTGNFPFTLDIYIHIGWSSLRFVKWWLLTHFKI